LISKDMSVSLVLLLRSEWIRLASVVVACMLSGCYSLKQVYYHGNLLSTRKPINVLLWNYDTDPQLKKDLEFVKDVILYAKKSGLASGMAYRTYIQSPYPYVSYTVQAAQPLEMELKKWSFPLLGEVPYLGFFHPENRDEKAKELKKFGYDVYKGAAGAFSSLGWYDDPVYSSMLRRSKASLAHLLFHELTHRTFWIPDDANLNEHMAEFVAGVLTPRYLKAHNMLEELKEYQQSEEDRLLFKSWLRSLKSSLEALYAQDHPQQLKLLEKQKIFTRFLKDRLPKFNTKGYQRLQNLEWNNARVLAYALYEPQTEPFEAAFACSKSKEVGSFLRRLEGIMENTKDIPKALDQMCDKGKVY